jgi:hypothetical protein
MKTKAKEGEGTPNKKPSKNSYDLRLGQEGKFVPVDSLISCNENVWKGEPTGTKLIPLNELQQSSNRCSYMEIGYDTEFTNITQLATKYGSKVECIDGAKHFNYLISTQYYVHLHEWDDADFKGEDDDIKKALKPKSWSGVLLHNPDHWPSDTITKKEILQSRLSFSEFIHCILQSGHQKGILKRLPKNIHLLCHFNVADIDKFSDIQTPQYGEELPLIKYLQTIRKSYSHNKRAVTLITDKNDDPFKEIKLRIYDTINLTPASGGLKVVGDMLHEKYPNENLRKIDIGLSIENMLQLRKSNFKLFYRYGLQDAKIPIYYAELIRGILIELFPKTPVSIEQHLNYLASTYQLPATLTSIGAMFLEKQIWANKGSKYYPKELVIELRESYGDTFKDVNRASSELCWLAMLGAYKAKEDKRTNLTSVEGKTISTKTGTISKTKYFANVEDSIALIQKTYYGGRNEQYFYGVSPFDKERPIYDYDLVSAYPTAMLCVGKVDWKNEVEWKGDNGEPKWEIIEDFENYVSYFHVSSFSFPDDVKYPTIPVRNIKEDGILFPKEGRKYSDKSGRSGTYINGVEIYVARKLGAKITLNKGCVFPMDKSFLPYEEFVKTTIIERRKAEAIGDDVMKQFWKELMNSLYGKTAQGISEKRVYDIQKNESKTLGKSTITSYPLVSIVTSMVRGVFWSTVLCTAFRNGQCMKRLPIERLWLHGTSMAR